MGLNPFAWHRFAVEGRPSDPGRDPVRLDGVRDLIQR
jgi:hypothetical protein